MNMNIPTNLKHKPVIVVENYETVDGLYANDSDAKGLSLGLAQWSDRGKVYSSAKVWRYTGEKWSRQSEELPLHRVLDLALLICQTQQYMADAYRYPKLYNPENPTIARIPMHGEAMNIAVCTDNPKIDEDIELFRDALIQNGEDERIGERLSNLANILCELGYCQPNYQVSKHAKKE